MGELNDGQKELATTLEGMIVADAGPGTGKTTTIVQRYVNILNKNVDPNDILMVTFTRNSAQEMKDRISAEIYKPDSGRDIESAKRIVRNLRAMTFDSLCLNIVLNSPEEVSDFFRFKEDRLSRGASLVQNETLNLQDFKDFYADFALQNAHKYAKGGQDPAALIGKRYGDLYRLLCKLMSRGIIPLECEWFADGQATVDGDVRAVKDDIRATIGADIIETITDSDHTLPCIEAIMAENGLKDDKELSEYLANEAANENRFRLTDYIRDVYYNYIRHCVIENRLTFGVAELMAFAILYTDKRARDMYSVRYMMVDEFQDTNELQMKICLMLLKEPNLCVVGDWKQGIYGFRFVSKENITQFELRARQFIKELNSSKKVVDLPDFEVRQIKLTENYRSSELILSNAFHALEIMASSETGLRNDEIVKLEAKNGSYNGYTDFELLKCSEKNEEAEIVAEKILDYMYDERYVVMRDGKEDRMQYNDIAVLCRTGWLCEQVLNACKRRGIPAFFQGNISVMSTREGKIALAWLRYVNNERDLRGSVAILDDLGYSMAEITQILNIGKQNEAITPENIPDFIRDQRSFLKKKVRRPNNLMTSIFGFYKLNNDITQSIINIISSAYDGSLLTIPDLIRLIEEDIASDTEYDIEPSLNTSAVTIQTMHKSKGLEYPAVIVAGVNQSSLPNTSVDKSTLVFNDRIGIRCKNEYSVKEIDGVKKECVYRSWRYDLIAKSSSADYSEDRRLLFVAMTRAKQYLTMTAYRPSPFFNGYDGTKEIVMTDRRGDSDLRALTERPKIGKYKGRRTSINVHDLMNTLDKPMPSESYVEGKGADYGDMVHYAAYQMANGLRYDDSLPETARIREILDKMKGAKIDTEIKCVLPVEYSPEKKVSIKGTIDIIAEFDDHIEIHDYKTDTSKEYQPQHAFQLSVYAQIAKYKGKPIRCFIEYVSLNETVEIEPCPIERIEKAVDDYFGKLRTDE